MVVGPRITSIISILLLGTYCAQSQVQRRSAGLPGSETFEASTITKFQPQAANVLQSFPDAPSAQLSTLNDKLGWFGNTLDTLVGPDVTKSNFELPALTTALYFGPFEDDTVARNEFASFLFKYLYPSPLKTATSCPSTNSNLLSRSTEAASQVVIAHNDSGERVLNVRYLLAALTSAAVDTARQPSWAQSTSGTFSDFGSSLGSDAGMNVFRQFEPGIRKMLDTHSPTFVRRLEHITRD